MTPEYEYQAHYERGKKAGEEAVRLLSVTEINDMRERFARIANELETDRHDAAYARGFLRVTVVEPERKLWRIDPERRRAIWRRREW